MKKVKKLCKVFVLVFLIMVPGKTYAISGLISSAPLSGILGTLITTYGMQVLEYGTMIVQQVQTAKNTYDQLQKIIEEEKRALNNLRGIADVRSLSDFMSWTNRQMYLNREAEYQYNQLGVKIGSKNYKIADIDKIPDAMRTQFFDPYSRDFSEEERMEMFRQMGLAPSNYMYLKTWQNRNEAIAKNIMTYRDIMAEENEKAASRNSGLISKYTEENEELDINEISKEAHITAMHNEMLLRDLIQITLGQQDYQLSRDRMADTPPTPPQRSWLWDNSYAESITGHSYYSEEFEDF